MFSDGSCSELPDFFIVCLRSSAIYDVYLVLHDDHVAQADHLSREHMFAVLCLRGLYVG